MGPKSKGSGGGGGGGGRGGGPSKQKSSSQATEDVEETLQAVVSHRVIVRLYFESSNRLHEPRGITFMELRSGYHGVAPRLLTGLSSRQVAASGHI
jgi:hypothetical protein